jgi:hypothetical protein
MGSRLDGAQTAAADRIPLTEAQKAALKCARKLMQGDPLSFGLPNGWRIDAAPGTFYETVIAAVATLSPEMRNKLREHVEWIIGFDQAGAAPARSGEHR